MTTYTILIAVMILWGLYPIVTHYFVRNIDPLFLVSASTLVGAIPFIIKTTYSRNLAFLLNRNNISSLFFVTVFGTAGHILLFVGTKYTSGANTGLLLQIEPIYSLIIGIFLFKETISISRLFATVVMIAGAAIIVYRGNLSLNIGDVLILLTPLMYQLSHSFSKKMLDRGIDSSNILAVRQLLGGIVMVFFASFFNSQFFSFFTRTNISVAIFLGLYLSLVVFLWYAVLKNMLLSFASSFLPLTAAVSLLGSGLFLKETINAQQIVGFLLIIIALAWLSKSAIFKTAKDKSH